MQTLTADIVDDPELLKLPPMGRLELALLLRARLTEALEREEVREISWHSFRLVLS